MPYITREDGERFVIPSYREVISAKKPALLKREVTLLSETHGEYITLQRKNIDQYEIAFSNEPGYLLGESVWSNFKRPPDLIYCEQIPNTSEAILVIVKGGSVYLDGSFPIDSIPDELVIFRTQQSNFDIYIYGDVPISKEPAEDKFALDSSSVRSFTILETPVFPTLPLVRSFRLQLVEVVLREHGIGVFPLKKLIAAMVIAGVVFFGIEYIATHKRELPAVPAVIIKNINPYQGYVNALSSPNPSKEIQWVAREIPILYAMDGWTAKTVGYASGSLTVGVQSSGARTSVLYDWAKHNFATVNMTPSGFTLTMMNSFGSRAAPRYIYNIPDVIANITDTLSYIIPGNNLVIGKTTSQGRYSQLDLIINVKEISPSTLELIGQQLDQAPKNQLPLVLSSMDLTITDDGYINGSIYLKVLGS